MSGQNRKSKIVNVAKRDPSVRKSLKVLHFADAHIDMVTYGRIDGRTGFPVRVLDFLSALDQIVEAAIAETVDLVVFAGDAYRNQRPHPKYKRAWQARIKRLSEAGIPTVLVVGNHDTSPSARGANALREFDTLGVPHVHVAHTNPALVSTEKLGMPAQVLAVPWISEQSMVVEEGEMALEDRLEQVINGLVEQADPDLPLILAAHVSVDGAQYGSERAVLLGKDLVLSGSIVRNPAFDYVALGHIHKHQELNKGNHPPIVYSGSIERVDFGEIKEQKGFVIAEVGKGETDWRFVPLKTRAFKDKSVKITQADGFMETITDKLPSQASIKNAVCRLILDYPRAMEPLLDEVAIGRHYKDAFSFQLVKRRSTDKRTRLGDTVDLDEMTPYDQLQTYWQSVGMDAEDSAEIQTLAKEVFKDLTF